MKHGLVFGKFYPLHNGHLALIDFAYKRCDLLTILVCASNRETISGTQRAEWLEQYFANSADITVKVMDYKEEELTNTSVSSREVSKLWAAQFNNLLPNIDIVFTSEKYGDYLAEYMNIEHHLFDLPRHQVTISASDIRKKPLTNWAFIPTEVKPFFVKKVILLGTESTGKTTITEKLAVHFQTTHVREMGRELIPNSKECSFEGLERVAIAHAHEIKSSLGKANRLLFIDTDINITQSYAKFLFGKTLTITEQIEKLNSGDLYLYLDKDVEFVQDGTRLELSFRNELDLSHKKILKEKDITYEHIQGNWEERLAQCLTLVYNFVNKY